MPFNEITLHSQKLPENLQKEVLDFICFLEARYSAKPKRQDRNELTDEEIEQACGVLEAPAWDYSGTNGKCHKKMRRGFMIAVDTNVLVHLIVNGPDSKEQVNADI